MRDYILDSPYNDYSPSDEYTDKLIRKNEDLQEEIEGYEELCAEQLNEIKQLKESLDHFKYLNEFNEKSSEGWFSISKLRFDEISRQDSRIEYLNNEISELKHKLKEYEHDLFVKNNDEGIFNKLNNITKSHMNKLLSESGIQL